VHTLLTVTRTIPLAILFLLVTCLSSYGQTHNLPTNLQYRLTQGDLGDVTPAPFRNSRTLGIEQGGDLLLQDCLDHPLKWARDSMVFRLGHRHAASTTSCREYTSPSMHVVFYPRGDGSHEARIHFDLHGPRDPVGHFGEVVRNRLTFGRTSEYAVYRGLAKARDDPNTPVPPPAYDFSAHLATYYKAAFGPSALARGVFTGGVRAMIGREPAWGQGTTRYRNHVEANLVQNVLKQSIEFGVGAALQQDETFATSHQERVGARVKSALYHSLFVQGRGGNELAFPRIAAAVGTSWITYQWHPWTQEAPNPWVGTAMQLSRYALASYWHEFRPDIKRQLTKLKRKP
jgi:hypothetical protein